MFVHCHCRHTDLKASPRHGRAIPRRHHVFFPFYIQSEHGRKALEDVKAKLMSRLDSNEVSLASLRIDLGNMVGADIVAEKEKNSILRKELALVCVLMLIPPLLHPCSTRVLRMAQDGGIVVFW